MKHDQINVGGTYIAKVSDKLVTVRIDGVNRHGGWDATNMATNKKVRVKSAKRLRGPATKRQVAEAATPDATPANTGGDPTTKATEVEPATQDATVAAPAAKKTGGTKKGIKTTKAKKAPAEPKAKKTSGLDAAALVLKNAGEPMRCSEIVKTMLDKGMWKTGGKTPAATIYAAILREIQVKGDEARFKKTDRGFFAFNGK